MDPNSLGNAVLSQTVKGYLAAIVLLTTIVLIQQANGDTQSTNSSHAYIESDGKNAKLINYTTISSVPKKSKCALYCLNQEGCEAFYYDADLKTCDIGSVAVRNSASTQSSEFNQPRHVMTLEGRDATIWEPDGAAHDYLGAKSTCRAQGGSMLSAKTVEEAALLKEVFQVFKFRDGMWIGLDDLAQENVFRWVDDGSVLDPAFRSQLFSPGEPNNYGGVEHCVQLWRSSATYSVFMDSRCSINLATLCQKN